MERGEGGEGVGLEEITNDAPWEGDEEGLFTGAVGKSSDISLEMGVGMTK